MSWRISAAQRRLAAVCEGSALLLACGALGSLTWAPRALAAEPVCGTTPQDAEQPVKATLALADADSETVTAALYGRDAGVKQLTLVYTVTGCQLIETLEVPQDPPPIGPPKDAKIDTIPRGVVRIEGDPQIDGNQYIVRMQVFTDPPAYIDARTGKTIAPTFDPGTYGGFVQLKANWMRRTGTAVAISRSENRWELVLAGAALGALGGFVFFMLLHWFSHAKLLVGPKRIVFAGVLSVGVGAYVAYSTNYLNQDVWTFGANTIALLTAGFTAATSGQLVTGLLGKVYDDHAVLNPKAPPPAAEAPRPGEPGVADRIRHPFRTHKATKVKREQQKLAAEGDAPSQAEGTPGAEQRTDAAQRGRQEDPPAEDG